MWLIVSDIWIALQLSRGKGLAALPSLIPVFKVFSAIRRGTANNDCFRPPVHSGAGVWVDWAESKVCVFLGLLLQEGKLVEKDMSMWQLQGEPTVLITLAHIFNYFSPLMVSFACPLQASVGACYCALQGEVNLSLCWEVTVPWRTVDPALCLQCKVYLVEDVLMTFLLSILERGGAVEAHPLIQQLLDLMWLLMEVSCQGAGSSPGITGRSGRC